MNGSEIIFAASGLALFILPMVFYYLRAGEVTSGVNDPVAEEIRERERNADEGDQ